MNYDDACDATVSAKEAKREIRLHNLDFNDFLADVGVKDEYSGKEVLGWLGY